jgi:hypothetical protein
MTENRKRKFLTLFLFLCFCLPKLDICQAHDLPGLSDTRSVSSAPPLSRIPNLIRVHLCRQGKGYTCGAASLQSVPGYFNDL